MGAQLGPERGLRRRGAAPDEPPRAADSERSSAGSEAPELTGSVPEELRSLAAERWD